MKDFAVKNVLLILETIKENILGDKMKITRKNYNLQINGLYITHFCFDNGVNSYDKIVLDICKELNFPDIKVSLNSRGKQENSESVEIYLNFNGVDVLLLSSYNKSKEYLQYSILQIRKDSSKEFALIQIKELSQKIREAFSKMINENFDEELSI